jgi:hypothetical protein
MAKESPLTKLQQQALLHNDRQAAFGDLKAHSATEMQRGIATEEGAIQRIIRAKVEGTRKGDPADLPALEAIRYYYKELAAAYYESTSNDTDKLQLIIKPTVEESLDNLLDNVAIADIEKHPLRSIGQKALNNIKKKLTLSGRVSSKANRFFASGGGALLAGAATRSPLIALAVYAHQKYQEHQEAKKNPWDIENNLLNKAVERQQLPGGIRGETSTPVADASIGPQFEEMDQDGLIEVGGALRPSLSNSDDDAWAYASQEDNPNARRDSNGSIIPLTSRVSGGSMGGSVDVSGIITILSRHTGILNGISSDTHALLSLARRTADLSAASTEESLLEDSPRSSLFKKSKTQSPKLSGFASIIDRIKDAAISFGPLLLGAIAAAGPALASVMSVAGPALAAAFAGWAGWKIGQFIDDKLGVSKKVGEVTESVTESVLNPDGSGRSANDLEETRKKIALASAKKFAMQQRHQLDPKIDASGLDKPTTRPITQTSIPPTTISTPEVQSFPKPPTTTPILPQVNEIPIYYESYAKEVARHESGGQKDDGYGAVNSLGYVGKYQMGAMALKDSKLVKMSAPNDSKYLQNDQNWLLPGGRQAFLANHELQEETMRNYTQRNYKALVALKVISPTDPPSVIAGKLGAAHLVGPRGVAKGAVGDAYGMKSVTYEKYMSASQTPNTAQFTKQPPTLPKVATNISDTSAPGRSAITKSLSVNVGASSNHPNGNVMVMNNTNNSTQTSRNGNRTVGIPAPVDNNPIISGRT